MSCKFFYLQGYRRRIKTIVKSILVCKQDRHILLDSKRNKQSNHLHPYLTTIQTPHTLFYTLLWFYVYHSTTTSIRLQNLPYYNYHIRNISVPCSSFNSDMGPIVIATGLSVLAGAALLKSVMDQNPMMGPGQGHFPRCSTCNGTGRVSCLCNRWSDGDRGCRTCGGSGRMVCSSCGGSGTGRPLPIRISARPPNQPN